MNDILTVKEASNLLGCHEMTIRNLDKRGKLSAMRDHNGYRVFKLVDLLKLKEERNRLRSAGDHA